MGWDGLEISLYTDSMSTFGANNSLQAAKVLTCLFCLLSFLANLEGRIKELPETHVEHFDEDKNFYCRQF